LLCERGEIGLERKLRACRCDAIFGSPTSGTSLRRSALPSASTGETVIVTALNAHELIAWAEEQGFNSTIAADDMHVTVAYSRQPVNWFGIGSAWGDESRQIRTRGGPRMVDQLGDEGAVVLHFSDQSLNARHREIRERGASWDFPSYLPHVTFTYRPGTVDLDKVKPYQGELHFGPEIFETISDDWQDQLREVSFAERRQSDDLTPDDTERLVDELIAADGYSLMRDVGGSLIERIAAAQSADEVADPEIDNTDRLYQALHRASFALRVDATHEE